MPQHDPGPSGEHWQPHGRHAPPSWRAALGLAAAGAALWGLLACATPAAENLWYACLATADAHFDAARWDEAQGLYRDLLATAPREPLRPYLHFQLAEIARHQGARADAAAHYALLAEYPGPDDAYPAKARLALAAMAEEDAGPDAALPAYEAVIVGAPESAAARHALRWLDDYDGARQQPAVALQRRADLYAALHHTALAPRLALDMANLLGDALHDPDGAGQLLLQALHNHPVSPLRARMIWRLADMAEAAGDEEAALQALDVLAREHDTSWSLGEYDSPLRHQAMRRRAEILAGRGALEAAIAEYDRLLRAYPQHSQRARFAEARARLIAASGDDARHRAALQDIIAAHPDSGAARRAQAHLRGDAATTPDTHPPPREAP